MPRRSPDDEDWPWVLDRCGTCGFDPSTVQRVDVPMTLSATVPRWRTALSRPDAAMRTADDRWSVVECSAHVRDLCRTVDERLRLMLVQDDPDLGRWDHQAGLHDDYTNEQPSRVAEELAGAVTALALHLGHVDERAWDRAGRDSSGRTCTVDTLARRVLHQVLHRLHTVRA
jgi:hypothetical protein